MSDELSFCATRLNGDGTESMLATDLPLSNPTANNVLTGIDTVAGAISPEIRYMMVGGERALVPWSTAIYASRGNSIVAGGILQSLQANDSTITLDAAGFTSYPGDMPYDGEKYFVKTDALDVARHIWSHLQSYPGGNLGMVLDSVKAGRLVGEELEEVEFSTSDGEDVAFEAGPLKLAWWLTDDLGEVLATLSEQGNFEWEERHTWAPDGTSIDHHLHFGAPRRGRRRQDLMLQVGEQVVVVPPASLQGGDWASESWMLGSGEGKSRRRGMVSRDRAGRLRRVAVDADKTLQSNKSCKAMAQSNLGFLSGDVKIGELVLRGLGSSVPSLGDEVHIEGGGQGWLSDYGAWVRVIGIQHSDPNLTTCSIIHEG